MPWMKRAGFPVLGCVGSVPVGEVFGGRQGAIEERVWSEGEDGEEVPQEEAEVPQADAVGGYLRLEIIGGNGGMCGVLVSWVELQIDQSRER
jgi:hypothetical protein